MLLGAVRHPGSADAVTLHVAVLVGAYRHIRLRDVRDRGQRIEQGLLGHALGFLQLRHRLLDPAHLGHQLLGPRLVLLRLGLADLLGHGIAALGGGLQGRDGALALVVEGDQVCGQGLHAPVPEALVESRGVLADGTDVVHGMRTCFVRQPRPDDKTTPSTRAENGSRYAELLEPYSSAARAASASARFFSTMRTEKM